MSKQLTKEEKQAIKDEAKKYGVKTVGVSYEDMLDAIEEAKASPVEEAAEEVVEEVKEVEKKEKEDYNAAIVLNSSKNEIRRYTREIHGENFAELAYDLVSKKSDAGYQLELKNVKPGIICPSCGHVIHQD